jgi:hypothetical protein
LRLLALEAHRLLIVGFVPLAYLLACILLLLDFLFLLEAAPSLTNLFLTSGGVQLRAGSHAET